VRNVQSKIIFKPRDWVHRETKRTNISKSRAMNIWVLLINISISAASLELQSEEPNTSPVGELKVSNKKDLQGTFYVDEQTAMIRIVEALKYGKVKDKKNKNLVAIKQTPTRIKRSPSSKAKRKIKSSIMGELEPPGVTLRVVLRRILAGGIASLLSLPFRFVLTGKIEYLTAANNIMLQLNDLANLIPVVVLLFTGSAQFYLTLIWKKFFLTRTFSKLEFLFDFISSLLGFSSVSMV